MKTIFEKIITKTAGAMLKTVGSQPQSIKSEEDEQPDHDFLNEEIIFYPEVKPKDSKEAILKDISIKLDRCMERHKLYLDPKISLTRVANIVGSNRTYISNIMAEKNGYRNYLNELRLRHMAFRLRKEQIRVKKRNDQRLKSLLLQQQNNNQQNNQQNNTLENTTPIQEIKNVKRVVRPYPKGQEDISILLSEPEDKIPPTRLTTLIVSCGFSDMRTFRRALFQSTSDYAEEIKGYIY